VVIMVGKHGEREPNSGLLAWLLFFRHYIGSNNRYFDDRESRPSLVYLLLYDGLSSKESSLLLIDRLTCEQTGAAAIELVTSTWAFWEKNAARHRLDNPRQYDNEGGATEKHSRTKVIWLCAMFFFAYVGAQGTPALEQPPLNYLSASWYVFLLSGLGRLDCFVYDPGLQSISPFFWN